MTPQHLRRRTLPCAARRASHRPSAPRGPCPCAPGGARVGSPGGVCRGHCTLRHLCRGLPGGAGRVARGTCRTTVGESRRRGRRPGSA
ncbi:hypothetical protein B5181_34930 [Streptomyces sp. 4F]|nr:hypothetical protein B5181_34930 [Streptomyces sp. 4F]